MNYTFPLSKQDVLLNAGFSILWQSLDLEKDSKLVKDNQKSLNLQLAKLTKENRSVATEFQKIAVSFITVQGVSTTPPSHIELGVPATRAPTETTDTSDKQPKSTRKQIQAIASRLSSFSTKNKNDEMSRRNTFSQPGLSQSMSPNPRANSTVSLSSTRSAPVMPTPLSQSPAVNRTADAASLLAINLDYFPFSEDPIVTQYNSGTTMLPPRKSPQLSQAQPNWEHSINNLDPNTPDMFNTVSPSTFNQSISASGPYSDWTNDIWQMSSFDLAPRGHVPQSLLSFSEESLTSAEELIFSAPSSHKGSTSTTDGLEISSGAAKTGETYEGIAMPVNDDYDFHEIDV